MTPTPKVKENDVQLFKEFNEYKLITNLLVGVALKKLSTICGIFDESELLAVKD